MNFVISKIIKELFFQLVKDQIIFTMLKNRLIDFIEGKIKDSETETDDKLLLPVIEALKYSKSDDFSIDLMRSLIDTLSKNSNIILMFLIDHLEEYILESRSKMDDMLFLPPINLLKKITGI